MASKPISGIFVCTRKQNVSQMFPHCIRIPTRLQAISVVDGIPAIDEKREHAFICVVMEQNSEALFEKEDEIYCWEISGHSEIDITEKGTKYAETVFQMEEYAEALILLEKEFERQNVGLRVWRLSKAWRFITEAKYLIGVIESEVAHADAITGFSKQVRVADLIFGLREKSKNAKAKLERKRGNLESQSHNISFFYFLFGTFFGLFISILLKFIS